MCAVIVYRDTKLKKPIKSKRKDLNHITLADLICS